MHACAMCVLFAGSCLERLLLLGLDLFCLLLLESCMMQQQNSNLTQELPQLLEDVEPQLHLAEAAFGAPPDAVNLWIGDERAATTFHKDHVRNSPTATLAVWTVSAGKQHIAAVLTADRFGTSYKLIAACRA